MHPRAWATASPARQRLWAASLSRPRLTRHPCLGPLSPLGPLDPFGRPRPHIYAASRSLVSSASPGPPDPPGPPGSSGSPKKKKKRSRFPTKLTLIVLGGLLLVTLSPRDHRTSGKLARGGMALDDASRTGQTASDGSETVPGSTSWTRFAKTFEGFSDVTDLEWSDVSDHIAGMMLPDWSKSIPAYIRKLQREMSLAPGSLADEIWREAHDPNINPEVQYAARVRVSDELCAEEQAFCARRRRVAAAALARYLDLPPGSVDPDDVPVIALCGSGGGLRALVAGTGSLTAAAEAGLFDCATYTAGVSGSCWLQALYFSSFTRQRFDRIVHHLQARLGVHIAYPPDALSLLTAAPTDKYLLSGTVEKLKGDPNARFGLVDVYGILLAARLLVPKGDLGVCEADFKLSNQRQYLTTGQNPMPIYTAVRHEIPEEEQAPAKAAPAKPTQAWFQWFEITPYEFFCEEFSAGIPTWAMGRKFQAGWDVPPAQGDYHLPETRLPLMLGVFGSAFCATLSHYYKEIRPGVQSLPALKPLDDLIWGRNDDLSKVHPIDPATLPNPLYGMSLAALPATVPPSLPGREYIQLMDAGMSNNLPLYPFLRPGRGVEVVVVFDASADIKKDNWLNVADGYARQRGIKGWPVGVGWPQSETPAAAAEQLKEAQDSTASVEAAEKKLEDVQKAGKTGKAGKAETEEQRAQQTAKELGYCTVWVGSTQEKTADAADAATSIEAIDASSHWRLTAPDAGLTLVYLPYLANEARVPGVNPATSEFMSTWNFIYTPEQVDAAVALARANFHEGADQIRNTVRAVYERKKQLRLQGLLEGQKARFRRMVRLGMHDRLVGDHFS